MLSSIPKKSLNILLLFFLAAASLSLTVSAAYSTSNQSTGYAIGSATSFSVSGSGTPTGQTFICPGGVPSKFFSSDLTMKASSASGGRAKGNLQLVGTFPEQGNFFINVTITSVHVDSQDHHFSLKGVETMVQCGIKMKAGASVVVSGTCGQNAAISFIGANGKQHGAWNGPVKCS
jgi:hypothetical protein